MLYHPSAGDESGALSEGFEFGQLGVHPPALAVSQNNEHEQGALARFELGRIALEPGEFLLD